MKAKGGRPVAEVEAPAAPREVVESRSAERLVIALPRGLLEQITKLAEKRRMTRTAYIRMVLNDHLGRDSIEDIDRQLYELAKRTETQGADGH